MPMIFQESIAKSPLTPVQHYRREFTAHRKVNEVGIDINHMAPPIFPSIPRSLANSLP